MVRCTKDRGIILPDRSSGDRPGQSVRSTTLGGRSFGGTRCPAFLVVEVLRSRSLRSGRNGGSKNMSNKNHGALPGSDRKPLTGAKLVKPVTDNELIRVTIVLHRRTASEPVRPA